MRLTSWNFLFAMTLWGIWRWRNKLIFEAKEGDSGSVWSLARKSAAEIYTAMRTFQQGHRVSRWVNHQQDVFYLTRMGLISIVLSVPLLEDSYVIAMQTGFVVLSTILEKPTAYQLSCGEFERDCYSHRKTVGDFPSNCRTGCSGGGELSQDRG